MNTWLRDINDHPFSKKGISWLKLLSITASAQVIVQAIGFVCGILVIRILSTEEYALYTLANTMLGTMVVLSDGGISAGVMAQAAGVWKDKEKLGAVIVTGFDLRKKFAVLSLLVSIPLLLILLRHKDASWLMSILIVLVLIPAFISMLSTNLLETPAKLKQDIIPLQKNQLGVNFGRLLILTTLFVFPWTFVAILASGITQVWGNYRLRKIVAPYLDLKQKVSIIYRKNILRLVKRTLPEAIYYCISGQLTIWILAIFGSTDSLAEIGALSRIAIALNLITIMFKTLIVPRFARLNNEFRLVRNRFLSIQAILILIFCVIIGIVLLFGTEILWVLGPKYNGLEKELTLVMAGSSLGVFSALTYSTCVSRSWVMNPVISIPINVLTIIGAIVFLNVATLYGVLIFNIIVAAVHMIMNSTYGIYKVHTMKNQVR